MTVHDRLHAKRKAMGLCQSCGHMQTADGHTLCQSCLDRRKRNSETSVARSLTKLTCTRCGGQRDRIDRRICMSCAVRDAKSRNEKLKKRREESPAPVCPRCRTRPAASGWSYCEVCIETSRLYRHRLKADVIEGYGGACRCCGEAEPQFMTLDHIDGGGSAHKKAVNGNQMIYSFLRANNYPSGYQLLCFNCNSAKGAFGMCPHERDRQKANGK